MRPGPDAGVERFLWTERGLVAHTNQLGGTNVTRYGYDAALRLTAVTNANLEVVRYAYNAAGNLLTLTDGKNQVTTWSYDIERRVTNKLDQAGVEIFCWTYDGKGRLASRWSKAKGSTAYTYDAADNLTFVNYPGSPDLAFQYDPLGRMTNMVDALGAAQPTRWFYAPNGQLAAEDGPWPNDTVSYAHDAAGRRTALTAQLAATKDWTQGYGWDGAGRLAAATLPGGLAFAYAYTNAAGLAAAPARLVSRLALPTGAYLTNRYDAVARLLATELRHPAHTVLNSHGYLVNAAHQRTRHTRTDGNHVAFEYDPLGQLKKATGTGGSSTESLGYGYDAAWNLGVRTNGGTAYPYTVNGKNELTAAEGATFSHDFNGNRTQRTVSGGYVTYVYDDENQLVEAATDTAYTPMSGRRKVAFTYDGLGRLKVKQPYLWSGSGYWQPETATRYVYDGRRVIQERAGSPPAAGRRRPKRAQKRPCGWRKCRQAPHGRTAIRPGSRVTG